MPDSHSALLAVLRREAELHSRNDRLPLILHSCEPSKALLPLCEQFADAGLARELPLIHGVATAVPVHLLESFLAAAPANAQVTINHEVQFPRLTVAPARKPAVTPGETAGHRLPGLDKVWSLGYTGKGQVIAVIDSGIFPHPDLQDRLTGWMDFAERHVEMVDPMGHGTHVSGILAGSGLHCGHLIQGVAPDAKLVALRISCVADAILALHWCIENQLAVGITVVNMSLGDVGHTDWHSDPWAVATQKVIEAGLVVVAAAGNDGPRVQSVCTPGNLPDVITVGATDDHGTSALADDEIASFTSRGPDSTQPCKPDVYAPGVQVFSTLALGSSFDCVTLPHVEHEYVAISGSSQATPMVAGLAALLKQAQPTLTPFDVGEILRQSAHPLVKPARVVQADKALELALKWPAGSAKSRTECR